MGSLLNLSGSALLNKFTPRDYSLEYFTIESLADSNTVSIKNVNCNTLPYYSYSTDNGTTWSSITAQKGKTLSVATINNGGKVLFKCSANNLGTGYSAYNCFLASGNHIVYGNAMSLLYGDNFASNSEFRSGSTNCLVSIFRDDTYLSDASNLILPALTCTYQCYNGMFRGCTNLAHGPELPATTYIGGGCYASMFEGCVNLEEAPDINLVDLSNSNTGNAKSGIFNRMFCMSRTTTVTAKMTKAPIIRASTIFSGKNLSGSTDDPNMNEMFKGNGSLTEVTCLATSFVSDTIPTKNWLLNVSPTGTFYKHPDMNDWPTGVDGIPSGWTVVDYVES